MQQATIFAVGPFMLVFIKITVQHVSQGLLTARFNSAYIATCRPLWVLIKSIRLNKIYCEKPICFIREKLDLKSLLDYFWS